MSFYLKTAGLGLATMVATFFIIGTHNAGTINDGTALGLHLLVCIGFARVLMWIIGFPIPNQRDREDQP